MIRKINKKTLKCFIFNCILAGCIGYIVANSGILGNNYMIAAIFGALAVDTKDFIFSMFNIKWF